jgi:hypothetical protein
MVIRTDSSLLMSSISWLSWNAMISNPPGRKETAMVHDAMLWMFSSCPFFTAGGILRSDLKCKEPALLSIVWKEIFTQMNDNLLTVTGQAKNTGNSTPSHVV